MIGAGGLVGEQLESDGRAVHHLAPPPDITRLGKPVAPERCGGIQQCVGHIDRVGGRLVVTVEHLQHEQGGVSSGELDVGAHHGVVGVVVVDSQCGGGDQSHSYPVAGDQHAVAERFGGTRLARVVRSGVQPHLQVDLAAHTADPSDQPLPVVVVGLDRHRHEVVDFGDAVGGEEASDQHGGVGEVELVGAGYPASGRQPPATAPVAVEDRAEHTRRVKARRAEPVDGAVGAHQGTRAQITDQAVIRYAQSVFTHPVAASRPGPPAPAPPAVPMTRARRTRPSAESRAPADISARAGRPRRRG